MKKLLLFFSLTTITHFTYTMDEKEKFNKNMQLLPNGLKEIVLQFQNLPPSQKNLLHIRVLNNDQVAIIAAKPTDPIMDYSREFSSNINSLSPEITAFLEAINYVKKQSFILKDSTVL